MKKTRIPWVPLFLALGALFLAGCGALPTTNWAGLATDGSAVYAAQSQLLAVDPSTPSGALNWRFPDKVDQKNLVYGIPAVADGIIYVGNYNNDFYALDAKNGSQKWVYNKPDLDGKGRFLAGPVITGNLILVPSTDHYLYAFDNNGAIVWRFKSRGSLWAAVATDGKLAYLPGMDHYLYAVDLQSGKSAWELNLGASMIHAPVLAEDGMLYITTLSQELVAVNTTTHQVAWKVKTDGSVWSAPLLLKDNLYFGTDKKKVYALSTKDNGKIIWQKDASGAVIGAPVLLGDALVFVTETGDVKDSGDIFTVSLDTGNKLWTRNLKGKLFSSPVVVGERVVVSAEGGDAFLTWYDADGKNSGSFVMPK